MSFWLTDPELFLYAKGTGPDDVHLWRCNKPTSSSSSSLVVPMESDDFDYVSKVKNHVKLIGDMFHWKEPDYKRLVKYIYEKRLLVNGQGFVIMRVLHEADKDGNKKIDDANDEEEVDVPAIYIRSLDVLPLKPYIPMLRERPIPLRTVKYLGDVNGKAALMEVDSQVTKLTTRVENLEAGSTRLESKNNTLDTSVTKLTAGLATTTCNVSDLQSKNKVLEADNKTLDSNVKTLEGKVTKLTDKVDDLESKNKTLEGKVTTLTADQATQMSALTTSQRQLNWVLEINPYYKMEVWMNYLTNSEWVGFVGLTRGETYLSTSMIVLGQMGAFTVDDDSTNIMAKYWDKIKYADSVFKSVCLEDLPNKEKARFTAIWFSVFRNGKTYAWRSP